MKTRATDVAKILGLFLLIMIFVRAGAELYKVAWGTGNSIGEFSLTWAGLFIGYCGLAAFTVGVLVSAMQLNSFGSFIQTRILSFRERIQALRFPLLFLLVLLPACFLQLSMWGIVFQGFYFRLLIWLLVLVAGAILISQEDQVISWNALLVVLILTAGIFSIFAALKQVTSYPFSLGWSEGNRLWDYSVMFGRQRYDYPADKNIFVFLETGRQFIGALPFLIPDLTIKAARAWVASLNILPYILLGLVSFRSFSNKKSLWLILSLWTYLLLGQGPIHPPLLFGAILIALAWGSPLWLAICCTILAGYYISISRFTWIFAPVVWIFILEIRNVDFGTMGFLRSASFRRAVTLALSTVAGSVVLPLFIHLPPTSISSTDVEVPGILKITENLRETLTRHDLLWYRLFPNETYGPGILVAAAIVVAPLAGLLYYLLKEKQFIKNNAQLILIGLSSLLFLTMGLIVSTKIGGGGDLHNLDMFLISLFFTFVLVFSGQGRDWIGNTEKDPLWVKALIIISLVLPALIPLQSMRSYNYIEKSSSLLILTDNEKIKPLDLYPSQNVIDDALADIRTSVEEEIHTGGVLFMDQRQLLTFGFVKHVPLFPEYDKKILMEQALASDSSYFDAFYDDLKNKTFSLIVIQPQFIVEKGLENQFGEENDAWVKWVAQPLLCYYEVKKMPYRERQRLHDLGIQLLVPKKEAVDCGNVLP